ncbi:MAG: X2-like carbohydrate binding domain-containing protein, partial [Oscillospiraceae bacterium]
YKKLSNTDVVVTATLNDNTIKEVKLGDTTLTAEQCVIENEKITIKSGYLNTLQPESHTFTVSYKPLGEEFVKGDEPLKSSFTIDIERCTFDVKLVDFTAPKNLEYDSTAKSAQVTVKNGVIGVGSITVNYYSNDIKLQGNPINAGTYTVKIDVADGLNYSGENDVVVSNFEIKNASQSAPTTPVGVNPTTMANNDGKITGVTLEMEYKKKSSQQWISVSSSETELKNLANGEYEIRFKAKTNYNAGEIKTITLEKFTGNQMKKPEAIFDAKTRKLNNVVSGQKYKITGNNENWILITDTTIDLSSIVNSTLKIQVMMPGDNTLTTDSEIQEIQVVKAEKPTLQKTDETIKNKKDGTITGLNNTMEWKTETGDWQAVKENSLSNLIPGKYFVRVSAQGNTIESDFVEIEILSGRQLTVTIPENTQGYTVSTEDSKQKAYGDNFTFKVEVKSGYNTS